MLWQGAELDTCSEACPTSCAAHPRLPFRHLHPSPHPSANTPSPLSRISTADENSYTNVLRLARALEPYDTRSPPSPEAGPGASSAPAPAAAHPGIPQLVYYSSGIGSEPNFSSWTGGLTGAGLVTKVEEAYSFVCMNWAPGDEVSASGEGARVAGDCERLRSRGGRAGDCGRWGQWRVVGC